MISAGMLVCIPFAVMVLICCGGSAFFTYHDLKESRECQGKLDQLNPGMSRDEVHAIMGTPMGGVRRESPWGITRAKGFLNVPQPTAQLNSETFDCSGGIIVYYDDEWKALYVTQFNWS